MNKGQSGFTLIELIIVIIILGVLAVTAAPRFVNISRDANIASLEGLAASIRTASSFVYAKSLIQGVAHLQSGSVDIDNDGVDDLNTTYGYPMANRTLGLSVVVNMDDDWLYGNRPNFVDFFATSASISGRNGRTNNNNQITSFGCYLIYTPPNSANGIISISYQTSQC